MLLLPAGVIISGVLACTAFKDDLLFADELDVDEYEFVSPFATNVPQVWVKSLYDGISGDVITVAVLDVIPPIYDGRDDDDGAP